LDVGTANGRHQLALDAFEVFRFEAPQFRGAGRRRASELRPCPRVRCSQNAGQDERLVLGGAPSTWDAVRSLTASVRARSDLDMGTFHLVVNWLSNVAART